MKQKILFSALIPVILNIFLITSASLSGNLALVLVAIPAVLLISGGLRSLIKIDYWAPHHIVCGALLALLLALPTGMASGAYLGYSMLVNAVLCFLIGGWIQIRLQPQYDNFPAPRSTLLYVAKVALDDAVLSFMSSLSPKPSSRQLRDAIAESETAYQLFAEHGWLENPLAFHQTPPELESVQASDFSVKGLDLKHISFNSEFEPRAEIPGRDRWQSYEKNRTAHAYILQHDKPGPWLICVHGAGMGEPKSDQKAFRVAGLHNKLGLNVAMYTLPVHGARAPGRIPGEKFFGISIMDVLHGESQAIWDLRRLVSWIRRQQATQIGVYGISLGAYTSAVFAGIEENLDCVIAGVPPSELIHTTEYLASPQQKRLMASAGVDTERDRKVHSVISPLCLSPLLEKDRRFIYAATGDQFVPVEQVRALWLHWDQPEIKWITGGHVMAPFESHTHQFVEQVITTRLATSELPSL